MFGIPFLTTAWWAAKALFVKDTASRFLNKEAFTALALVVCLVAVLLTGIWFINKVESGAVAGWQSKLMTSRYVAALRERKAQREADARASVERQVLVEQITTMAGHAATLEQQLAEMKANPQCYAPEIAKELRK